MRLAPALLAGLLLLPALAGGASMPEPRAPPGNPAPCHLAPASAPVCAVALQVVDAPGRVGVVEAPVSVGVVVPRDRVHQHHGALTPMALVDARGAAVPFTARATGWWEPPVEGPREVKWVLLQFPARSDAAYTLLVGPGARALALPPAPKLAPLAVALPGGGIAVDTGAMRATLDAGTPHLFASVAAAPPALRAAAGASQVAGLGPVGELRLVAHDGAADVPTTLRGWRLAIESSTPVHAVVRGTGVFEAPGGADVAELDVRLRFHRGATSVRVEHTFTWLLRPLDWGVRELSVRFASPLDLRTARLGLDDRTSAAVAVDLAAPLAAVQRSASLWDGTHGLSGARLGGWVEAQPLGGSGGLGVALRNVWQEYPKALLADRKGITVQLWPADHAPMSFREEAIMPPELYCSFFWGAFPFATDNPDKSPGAWPKCHGHEIPTTGGRRDHPMYGPAYFEHTGQGAARTTDIVVSFLAPAAAPTWQLNALLQHPLAVRQDPASALAVPFLGLRLAPADPAGDADLERVVEDIGRLALGRWDYTRTWWDAAHDHGFWRHGFTRFAYPDPGSWLARWMDGTQYDLQVVPWALWVRGGSHEMYEHGIDTARHAMDVATNHHSEREALVNGATPTIGGQEVRHWPPGFSKAASSMPFPAIAADRFLYQSKVHYLALFHHLTGDERARGTLDEVIGGMKVHAAIDGPIELPRPGARYAYNMNLFWTEAYLETWDPEVLLRAREWLGILAREFDAGLGQWKGPVVYVWHALLEALHLHRDLGLDPALARDIEAMLTRNLDALGYGPGGDGVLRDPQAAVAAARVAALTGDATYAWKAIDLARTIADAQPRFERQELRTPRWSQTVAGNGVWRGVLAPLLAAHGEAARRGVDLGDAPWVRDVHLSLAVDAAGVARLTAHLRPAARGDVAVDVRVANADVPNCAVPPATVRALLDGRPVLDRTGKPVQATLAMRVPNPQADPFPPHNPTQAARLVLPDALPGRVYTLEAEVAAPDGSSHCRTTNHATRVRLDAGGVPLVARVALPGLDIEAARRLAEGQGDVCDSRVCLKAFREGRAAPYAASRLVLRAANDTIAVWNPDQNPYTLRDATTGELLYRDSTASTTKLREHAVGAGRLVVLAVRDHANVGVHGVAPLVAATPGGWFDPGA